MIKAEIVAHSLNPQGDELISVLCTFPRIILAEINTHRMLSKNTSSSRAIPFNKIVEAVQNNPFIPIAWQKDHKGMQGTEYIIDEVDIEMAQANWNMAKINTIEIATSLNKDSVTKQLCNRLLEPFMWTTMLITGSKDGWNNFFNLRNPVYEIELTPDNSEVAVGKSWKELMSWRGTGGIWAGDFDTTDVVERLSHNKGQTEIHMMALAEVIYDTVNESTPKKLKSGEWHIPFEDKIDYFKLGKATSDYYINNSKELVDFNKWLVKVSTAMAAHTSYTIVGNEPVKSYDKWIELHDKLIAYDPPHSSPMEHCARAMNDNEYETFIKGKVSIEFAEDSDYANNDVKGWCYNLKGFIPYRYLIDNNLTI